MRAISMLFPPLAALALFVTVAPLAAQSPIDAVLEAELVAFDGAPGDWFGGAVDVDGDTAVVGAWLASAEDGAAYVYVRDGTSWSLQQKLTAAPSNRFGRSVSLAGDRLAVGSNNVVHVFRRSGTSWSPEAQLTGDMWSYGFGISVSLTDERLATGDYEWGGPFGAAGGFWTFTRSGTTWSQEAFVLNPVPSDSDEFGFTIALEGDRIAVGAPGYPEGGFYGAVYVYEHDGTSWSFVDLLVTPDSYAFAQLGWSVALSGDRILGGRRQGPQLGAAFLFERDGSSWSLTQEMVESDDGVGAHFGWSVALDGDRALVGKLAGHNASGVSTGTAYVFSYDGTGWREETKLAPPGGVAGDYYGSAVALDGETLIVGAFEKDTIVPDTGAAYVYRLVPISSSFCDDADGSLAFCPCGNPGAPDTGCDIQQGTGGVQLSVVTQHTAPNNRATVQGTGYPAASTPSAVVIRATELDSDTPVVFGDGLRCIGVPLVRLGATLAVGGVSTHTFGHGSMAGSGTFSYQIWFRNTPIMYCDPDAAFNLSNGATLAWP